MNESRWRRTCALALCAAMTVPALAAESGTAAAGTPETDPKSVTWDQLDDRIRNGSINAKILQENIGRVEAIDYDQMYDQLRKQMNSLADAQWYMILMGNSSQASTMEQAYQSMRDTFDDIKDGDLQKDNADVVRQLQDSVEQIVKAGESLYIQTLSLEQSLADGQRGLATIDRNLTELRTRQKLGQVSQQQVESLEQTRANTVSQLKTLENGIRTCKLQLQSLMGETPDGDLALGDLPTAAESTWTTPVYADDLAAAKEASWTLYKAKLTLDDAEDDFKDAKKDHQGSYYTYQFEMDKHVWAAAQNTYASTVESFENSFQGLYDALADKEQAWKNKETAVTYQESLLKTAETKYALGRTSYSAVQNARDEAASARSAADSAWRDLFSARNDYRIAVEHGLVG